MVFSASRTRILITAFLTPCIGFAAACGSDPIRPEADTDGISFEYTGIVNGTFHASGKPTRTSTAFLTSGNYATAMSYLPAEGNRASTISIMANEVSLGTYGNFLALGGLPAGVGTVSMSTSAGGIFSRSLTWNANTFRSDSQFLFNNGEFTVTEYTGTRVRGTFRGKAYLFVNGGNIREDRFVAVTNGRFDIAVNDTAAVDFRCRMFEC